jgi:hypothetical protein
VIGDEAYVAIDFAGADVYAKPTDTHAKSR